MSSEARAPDDRPAAGEPRWLVSLAYAAAATTAICWPAWPGMMSFDSLFAYREAKTGVTTLLWPPMHAYLFWLSQHLGADGWGLFVGQTFLLFLSVALAINLLVRSRLGALAGLAAFALGFVLVPELWGASMVHWRDVTTTSFALAGVAAWLAAARRRSRALLALAVAAFSMSAALRYNAILLIALAIPLMVWRPFLEPKPPAGLRPQLALALAVGLALAWASTQWRLPDLKQPERADNFAGAQEFDLLGISACADKTYLPPAMTAGWPIAPKQIRMAYDPRHLQIAFRTAPGAPRIVETTAGGEVRKIWSIAVRREPRCYLAHRAAVFVQQMGLAKDGVFYVTDLEIAPNDYGLTPAHPRLLQAFAEYIKVRQKEIWRRPFWLYLLAPIAVAAVWRRNGARLLFLALLGGAFAYPALLFVASPAADARYIFPSSAVCALLIAAAGAIFMDRRARRAPPSAGT